MTRVAILWHMHQPFYEDLVTHEHILPWVRLHALKDYYGMAAILREFPQVRVTFNLVPSLLVQLEAFAEDRARDRCLDLSLKTAADLTEADAAFIVANFFHAQRERMIDAHPRYAQLLALRGREGEPRAARRFTVDDLRDLQVWHKLAWIDPDYQARDARVARLIARGAGFTEDDKAALRDVELELLNKVIPAYRDLASEGRVELSTSPFYHPILPLLCDTDVYLRTHPDSRMPRRRFQHPEDAAEQLSRAVACHERLFGGRPAGVWPSEGSVSDAIVPIVANAGFSWMSTDELILARTLDTAFVRDGQGQVDRPERLYAPYRIRSGGAAIACAFRDHALSDRIGFAYARWAPDAAAADFVERLVEAGRRAARAGGEDPLIPIILDGENAWEHFEGGGRPFLRALYGRLASHPELRTVTMAEGCAAARTELAGIFPGSWIDANFSIWIGHADDQRAWSQLADARRALDDADVEPALAARAREEILIAEGSDWFWWYGDDHSSAHDQEFDDLFRRHLRNAYKLMQKPIPDELFVSNISTAGAAPVRMAPAGLLAPTLDGEETSYFEWLDAGVFETAAAGGVMQASEAPMLTTIRFGFDRERLFVRLDARRPLIDLLAEGCEFSVKFLQPAALRYSVCQRVGRLTSAFWERRGDPPVWVQRGPGGAVSAAGTVLEIALPLADLGVAPRDPVSFIVAAFDAEQAEIEHHPAGRAIETEVPDAAFEERNWTA